MVTKLGRLARSLPDARDIVADLTELGRGLQPGTTVHDLTDPVRRLFNVLAMAAEFEGDLTRIREGTAVAKAKGRLRGRASYAQGQAGGAPGGAMADGGAHRR